MGNINWSVRVRNVYFWMALVPAVVLLIQMVAAIFGWQLDLSTLQDRIIAAIDALFAVLTIIGVVNDPTTIGVKDSTRAMGYDEPYGA